MKFTLASILLLITIFTNSMFSQNFIDIKELQSDYTKKESKVERKQHLMDEIENLIQTSIDEIYDERLYTLIRELSLSFTTTDALNNKIVALLNNFQSFNIHLKHALLEFCNANFSKNFVAPIATIYAEETNSKIFSEAAIFLLKHDSINFNDAKILAEVESRLEQHSNNLTLKMLRSFLSKESTIPPLIDLLKHNFQENKTIIYSIHRSNRINPGITIIKKTNGKFVRNDDGTIFHIAQLACSVSNMPGFIRDGNTPQGIYSIVGSYVSPTKSIGPTANVLTRVPFGKPTSTFFHGRQLNDYWTTEDYAFVLPESWKQYHPIYEAYYAGKIGRRLIVMHGSTDDLDDYRAQPYYPLTSTRGCLSSKEIWDEESGECLESDQVKLMNAFFSCRNDKGFLVVVDLDDKNSKVTLEEIEELILEAEKK